MLSLLILRPLFWLASSLLSYFLLLLTLQVAWRSYWILWARRSKLSVKTNQAVLITGATSGIGLAVTKKLYNLGYSILVGYYDSKEPGFRELEKLRDSSKSLRNGQQMIFVPIDVASLTSVKEAFKQTEEALEKYKLELYALINNAGIGALQPFAWSLADIHTKTINTNLLGPLYTTRVFLPRLIESGGRILNVSSGLGLVPGAGYVTYGITKSALIYFTRALNMELNKQYGVKSLAILPTNLLKNTNIGAQTPRAIEPAIKELSECERKLYAKDIEEHKGRIKGFEEVRKLHNKLIGEQKSQQSSKRAPIGSMEFLKLDNLSELAKNICNQIAGKNVAETLEQSGALECFEDALRLSSPPELIFAGDNIYNILLGSLLLTMPTSCANLLGSLVAPSLYT